MSSLAPSEFAPSELAVCPGLFQPSAAKDGLLSRLRIPGGLLTVAQCTAIADLADQSGGGYVEVTNRANVQIRELQSSLNADQLTRLQAVGLASPIAAVDALRNIMASPTAGIDRQQLLDTRPLVAAWNSYLTTRPDFAVLSPKFSVCFDGGEAVSVRDRPNDISFVAEAIAETIHFRLHLSLGDRGASPCDVGVFARPEESLPLLIAMTEVYRDYTLQKRDYYNQRKPRLRDLLGDWGVEKYLQAVADRLWVPSTGEGAIGNRGYRDKTCRRRLQPLESVQTDFVSVAANSIRRVSPPTVRCVYRLPSSLQLTEKKMIPNVASIGNNSFSDSYSHLGIHAQQQTGLSYIGCVLPLGRLETTQLRSLAVLASQYGSDILRLTPWQNVLLADIPTAQIEWVQQKIAQLGLYASATHPHGAIVACSGTTGCKSSATNTQADALTLATYLEQRLTLDRPINIHFSGCEKSCAQHHASDITLLGITHNGYATYHVYVGDSVGEDDSEFGRKLYQNCSSASLPALIEPLLRVYQIERSHSNETFKNFVNRHTIAELKQMLSAFSDRHLVEVGG